MTDYNPWFNKDGQPLDTATANRLLGDMAYKVVGRTRITSATDPAVDVLVSTVWLGCNHNFTGDGPPIIFETMVFGGGYEEMDLRRYATFDEARQGHADMVTVVAATVPDDRIQDPAPE